MTGAVLAPRRETSASPPVLEVDGLTVTFGTGPERTVANDRLSLRLAAGETLGIVGESGSGKSVLCRALMRLLASPPATISAERMQLAGRDLISLDERAMRHVRGRDIAMIFQNPMTSLNPVRPIGDQIAEPLRIHGGLRRRAARAGVIELLGRVGIASPAKRVDEYPFQWSGGMLQRASIAMAMAAAPKVLLADEPTTALDVTIQDQILALLLDLQGETGMALVLVSHDMGVIAETSDRLAVMYAGRIVETGPTAAVFRRPGHPYSRGLLDSIPRTDRAVSLLETIPGQPPDMARLGPGCAFAPRCRMASADCETEAMVKRQLEAGHETLCRHPERLAADVMEPAG
ncbi:MAG: ABC transporter ATP-binding protein [Hyphomicrobiales bacterium]|nr:ABC transporter ATP-binding protein [Hyphomicrobiales bacterium]